MLVNNFSRRNALTWLGAGGAATALLVGIQTRAKADDWDRNRSNIVETWLETFYVAKDPAALAALYTNDGVFEDVPSGISIEGANNIKCFVKGALTLFGDFKLEILSAFTGRDYAVAEYFLTATNTGLYPSTPDNNTTGKTFRIRSVTILVLKGNKIERSADYYDNAGVLVQLGLIEAPPLPEPPSC